MKFCNVGGWVEGEGVELWWGKEFGGGWVGWSGVE